MHVKPKLALLLAVLLAAAGLFLLVPDANTTMGHQSQPSSMTKNLLRDQQQVLSGSNRSIAYRIKANVAGLLALNYCSCEDHATLHQNLQIYLLHESFPASELEEIKRRRAQEYQSFQKRSQNAGNLLLIAEANSPLQYPTQGVEVQPKKTILIPGLRLEEQPRKGHSVTLLATMGTFDVTAIVQGVTLKGEGTMHITLSSDFLSHLNQQLQFVTYTNTLFHPNTADTVQYETESHKAVFTVKVRHGVLPKLYDPGPKGEYNISHLVTIATKTFIRYDRLQILINSIRRFYPTVTIVIADDSEHPKPVTGPYIEHYTMPFGKGWFAGRNLAVSQVTTKYVLWVDDDFIFINDTKIEKLVDVLEKTTLDLVGGAVLEFGKYKNTFKHTFSWERGDEDGDCLHVRQGSYHVVPGFPKCVVTDSVVNFFLARTDKVQQVGFDPQLARIAHLEFFADGLGTLHVGSCDDVIVTHGKFLGDQSESDKIYAKYRQPTASSLNKQKSVFCFKNRLKCLTRP
ncbi:beta-1,4 N-acetylgalactosaminyltransferase 1-like [Paramormyrops kingsleyae]|uniref:Beta-1,4 N-acetylgalactosaminyltransferase n=1 Tax=Paramormyrops kingsleyae TaxID=1676925 RepID=A0A3B3QYL2_9TELE|nr:beta-1,4 N-acetylgalactosaminyltransferase 1-like [Paramormyrops kingsleyae]